MTFMEILRRSQINEDKPILKKVRPFEERPLYDDIKRLLENNAGTLSAPVPTIMAEIDRAIESYQTETAEPQKELSDEEIESKKNEIQNLKTKLKEIRAGGTYQKNPQLMNILETNLAKIEEVKNSKAFEALHQKDKNDKNIFDKQKDADRELKELEEAQGKEAQERKRALKKQLDSLNKQINSVFNPIKEMFIGLFQVKTYGKRVEGIKKPRNEIGGDEYKKGEWDNSLNKGIQNYKKLIAQQKKNVGKYTKTAAQNARKQIPIEIKRLEEEITGKQIKRPMILQQIYGSKGERKNPTLGRTSKTKALHSRKINEALEEIKLENYRDEIASLMVARRKQPKKEEESSLSRKEETLIELIDQLDSVEIDRDTKIRLKDRDLLTNKFVFELNENVYGTKRTMHPTLIDKIVDIELDEKGIEKSRKPNDNYFSLIRRLKELNPNINVPSKTKIKSLMNKLRTTKIGTFHLAQQINNTNFDEDIRFERLIKLYPTSNLTSLVNKIRDISDSWTTLSDMYYLRNTDEEFKEGQLEGWNDIKIINDYARSWKEIEDELEEGGSEKELQAHIDAYYKKQIKRIEQIYEDYNLYVGAAIKLLNVYIKAEQKEKSLGIEDVTDIKLEQSLEEINNAKKKVSEQYKTILADRIPNIKRLRREIKSEEKEKRKDIPKATPQKTELEEQFDRQMEELPSETEPYRISRTKRDKYNNPVYRINPTTGEKEVVSEGQPDISQVEEMRDDAWTKDFKQQLIRIENTNKKLDDAKQIKDEEERKKETQKIKLELKNLVDSKDRMLGRRLPEILGKIDNAIKRVRTEIQTSDVDETRRKELEELLEQYTKKKEEIKNEWKQ